MIAADHYGYFVLASGANGEFHFGNVGFVGIGAGAQFAYCHHL